MVRCQLNWLLPSITPKIKSGTKTNREIGWWFMKTSSALGNTSTENTELINI